MGERAGPKNQKSVGKTSHTWCTHVIQQIRTRTLDYYAHVLCTGIHTYIHIFPVRACHLNVTTWVGMFVFVWLRVSKMEISAVVPPPPQLPQRRGASRTRFNAHHMQHTYASQQPARKCARSLALSHSLAFNVTRACQAPGPSPSRCGRDGPFRRFVTLSAGVQRFKRICVRAQCSVIGHPNWFRPLHTHLCCCPRRVRANKAGWITSHAHSTTRECSPESRATRPNICQN